MFYRSCMNETTVNDEPTSVNVILNLIYEYGGEWSLLSKTSQPNETFKQVLSIQSPTYQFDSKRPTKHKLETRIFSVFLHQIQPMWVLECRKLFGCRAPRCARAHYTGFSQALLDLLKSPSVLPKPIEFELEFDRTTIYHRPLLTLHVLSISFHFYVAPEEFKRNSKDYAIHVSAFPRDFRKKFPKKRSTDKIFRRDPRKWFSDWTFSSKLAINFVG